MLWVYAPTEAPLHPVNWNSPLILHFRCRNLTHNIAEIPCGTNIFASSNFCVFCDFSSDPQNKFPRIKITANIFSQGFTPEHIFFNLNSLCTQNWFYIGYALRSIDNK